MGLSGLDEWSEQDLTAAFGEPEMEQILMASSEDPGPAAPKYTVKYLDIESLNAHYITDKAYIIDFGESYDMSSPPEGLGTPAAYRSPELIFDNIVCIGCDL